jgi:glycosyltransferase involved in cell wall biosynthesis
VPPRVLLVADFHLKYATQLAAGLVEGGAEAALLTRTHDFEFGGEPGAMRRYVDERLGGRGLHLTLGGRVRDPSALRELGRLRRRIGAWAPDVVHIQDGWDLRTVFAARRLRGGYALTIHDPSLHPGDSPLPWAEATVRRALIQRAGLIFVHGDALRDELREAAAPRAPIVVVPHGVAPPDVRPFPPRPHLLFFGRLSHYKGLDTLLDAMPEVWERDGDVGLTVAGDGPLPEHRVLADPRVTVVNRHLTEQEVPPMFAASSCVVLPYRQASQSGVGGLAQRFGRPVIATRTGALAQLVGSDSGLLVEPEAPAALAGAILEVIGDQPRAERMGLAGAARIERTTSWRRVGEMTLAAYAEHLGAPRPPRSQSAASASDAVA